MCGIWCYRCGYSASLTNWWKTWMWYQWSDEVKKKKKKTKQYKRMFSLVGYLVVLVIIIPYVMGTAKEKWNNAVILAQLMDHSLRNKKWFSCVCSISYMTIKYKFKSVFRISIKITIKLSILKIDACMKSWWFLLSNDGLGIQIGYVYVILVLNWMHILILIKIHKITIKYGCWLSINMFVCCTYYWGDDSIIFWFILSLHNTYNNNDSI